MGKASAAKERERGKARRELRGVERRVRNENIYTLRHGLRENDESACRTNVRKGRVDRNWAKSGGRLHVSPFVGG